jgi:predicted DsbA family dithiol-disulfide isomerase
VSDVACPWCAIGLSSLERALERVGADIGDVEIHMQPYELNPTMAPEGADALEYMTSKYGLSPEQLEANRARIVERGAAEGFAFGPRTHIWNTFDAHRLLFWAGAEGPPGSQRALKHALLTAYHGQGRNPGARDVLLELAGQVGLPVERAREVLERGEFADAVRQAERFWQELGIEGVPAVIINRKHLISGGQPHDVFEQALRQIAAEKEA